MRALALAVLLIPSVSGAQEILLQNDGFRAGPNETVLFQGGFVAGEIGAARLVPPGSGPYRVNKIRFLFGGAATVQDVNVHIWENAQVSANPGVSLHNSGPYTLIGSTNTMVEIDIQADNVFVTGPFRVGIELTHNGFPALAVDDDGTHDPDANYILLGGLGWVSAAGVGLNHDFIIRALIEDPSSTGDAGVADATTDAGAFDGSTNDLGPPGDSGSADIGFGDASATDGADLDASPSDQGAADASLVDGAPPDASPPDAGSSDVGSSDASGRDADGLFDARPADAGASDVDASDLGPDDAGSSDSNDEGCGCTTSSDGADHLHWSLALSLLILVRRRGAKSGRATDSSRGSSSR